MDNNTLGHNPEKENHIGKALYELLSVFQEIDRNEEETE